MYAHFRGHFQRSRCTAQSNNKTGISFQPALQIFSAFTLKSYSTMKDNEKPMHIKIVGRDLQLNPAK